MSCTKQTTAGNIWKYVLTKITQAISASSTVSYVTGNISTTISKTSPDTIMLTIGPVTFQKNIQTTDSIEVATYIGNTAVSRFTITGITANQGQQYIITVYFTYT
jgi:hypothetical protein